MQSYKLINSDSYITTHWSGGDTTQLYIFPENADFGKRDFLFRVSSATVRENESDFTPMPGFKRKLMLLSGDLTMEHEGHHTCQLYPLMQDAFWGDWHTVSHGHCVDFNLIAHPEVSGDLLAFCLGSQSFNICEKGSKMILYAYCGKITINLEGQPVRLSQSETLVLDADEKQELKFSFLSETESASLIIVIIRNLLPEQ